MAWQAFTGPHHAARPQWTPMYQQQATGYHPHPHEPNTYKPVVISETLEVGADAVPEYRRKTKSQRFFGGLKRTLRSFFAVAIIVLLVNIAWLIYAQKTYGIVNGYGTIERGDCHSVKKTNTWLHLLINVLSTALLTGSNAFMAAYGSPTREEIDKAHARRKWLHVGTSSFKNMTGISWSRSLLIVLLALASLPFHLLYNSLVFASLTANSYYWTIATESFLTGQPFDILGDLVTPGRDGGESYYTGLLSTSSGLTLAFNNSDIRTRWDTRDQAINDPDIVALQSTFADIQMNSGSWEKLDNRHCKRAYGNVFQSTHRNVVLITSTQNDTNSIVSCSAVDLVSGESDSYSQSHWLCADQEDPRACSADVLAPHDDDSWSIKGYPIEYCLSQRVSNTCSVQFSMRIMQVILAFNAVKVLIMAWMLFRLDAQHLITCTGDAAASFLRAPDMTTRGMCLAGRLGIDKYWRAPGPYQYDARIRRRWGSVVSKTRLTLFLLVMIVSWAGVLIFGGLGIQHTKDLGVQLNASSLWNMGFGSINPNAIVFASQSDVSATPWNLSLIANIPQPFLALIYLVYMSLMTGMFNARDWSRFARVPQTLMVSSPAGTQRGTWLVGAPWKYGFSLLGLQMLLHWFVSQSLFMIQITFLDKLGRPMLTPEGVMSDTGTISNCGYSPIAIICSAVGSIVLVGTTVILIFLRFPAGSPPVVSTCSAAISAACHLPSSMYSDAVVYEKLGWGVTSTGPNGVGHCSLGPEKAFKSGAAGSPLTGTHYAGLTPDSQVL